jgi:hypothetical protein
MLTHSSNRAHSVRVTQSRTFPILGEATLAPETRAVLQQIGAALDERRRLRAHIHGLITVDNKCALATLTKEIGNERQAKRGSTTRSRERAAGGKGPSGRSRPTSARSWVGGGALQAVYEGQVTRLAEAYPTLKTFPDENGMWLLVRSSIISGLPREATFLVALPYRPGATPRAWAFWIAGAQTRWIGPRHTNFRDGSICAFSPHEGAWFVGEDLRTLLDLYSVWAVRHLHLEVLGRWPGKQYALLDADPRAQAFYRSSECKDDELCGCGSETRRYFECCKPSDMRADFVQTATIFLQAVPGGLLTRRPPPSVVGFIEGRSALPRIADVHLQFVGGA